MKEHGCQLCKSYSSSLISGAGCIGICSPVPASLSVKTERIAESHRNRTKCHFINSSHERTVNCKNSGLQNVPEGLPTEATVLNLYGNNITTLHNTSFKDVPNLVILIASHNPLSFIETESMWSLPKLGILSIG